MDYNGMTTKTENRTGVSAGRVFAEYQQGGISAEYCKSAST